MTGVAIKNRMALKFVSLSASKIFADKGVSVFSGQCFWYLPCQVEMEYLYAKPY